MTFGFYIESKEDLMDLVYQLRINGSGLFDIIGAPHVEVSFEEDVSEDDFILVELESSEDFRRK
jgi:hypothetical protein